MKISVIVPAYNVESYIERTLDSILKSDYTDFEIILVNDGSMDKTGEICGKYAKQYKNIKYLSQRNQGVSIARNHALDYADGEWVIFVDADDTISSNFLKLINKYADDNDILFFGDVDIKKNKNKKIDEKDNILKEKMIYTMIAGEQFEDEFYYIQFPVPWAKAYRREILLRNNIYFPENIKIGEDLLFNLQCYMKMKKGMFCAENVYSVTIREDSTMHRYHDDFIQIDREFHKCLLKILKKNKIYSKYKKAVYKNILNGFWQIMMKRIYAPMNKKENNKQKYILLKNVRNDKIYDMAFRNIKFGEIFKSNKFTFKQKIVVCLIKLKLLWLAHEFIILWKKKKGLE